MATSRGKSSRSAKTSESRAKSGAQTGRAPSRTTGRASRPAPRSGRADEERDAPRRRVDPSRVSPSIGFRGDDDEDEGGGRRDEEREPQGSRGARFEDDEEGASDEPGSLASTATRTRTRTRSAPGARVPAIESGIMNNATLQERLSRPSRPDVKTAIGAARAAKARKGKAADGVTTIDRCGHGPQSKEAVSRSVQTKRQSNMRLSQVLLLTAGASTAILALSAQENPAHPMGQDATRGQDISREQHTPEAPEVDGILATWLLIENNNEIALSQIAQQRAQDPEVKQFAQSMVEAHRQMAQGLQPFAADVGFLGTDASAVDASATKPRVTDTQPTGMDPKPGAGGPPGSRSQPDSARRRGPSPQHAGAGPRRLAQGARPRVPVLFAQSAGREAGRRLRPLLRGHGHRRPHEGQ